MFTNQNRRFMTRAIAESLHMEVQVLLWNLIDHQRKQGNELDYLQVFELTSNGDKQKILHRQEVPPLERSWLIALRGTQPIDSTVWCIDDGENQMMLYPSDY